MEMDAKKLFSQTKEEAEKEEAEKGDMEACYNLGKYYEYGIGVEENKSEAINLYKKAAEYGNLDALFKLGNFYSNGTGVEFNDEEAFGFYKEAAIKGHKAAQNKLGVIYENSKEKKIKACYWYKKSAAGNGYNLAYYNM